MTFDLFHEPEIDPPLWLPGPDLGMPLTGSAALAARWSLIGRLQAERFSAAARDFVAALAPPMMEFSRRLGAFAAGWIEQDRQMTFKTHRGYREVRNREEWRKPPAPVKRSRRKR